MEFYLSLFLSFLTTIILVPIFGKISNKYKIVKRNLYDVNNFNIKNITDKALHNQNAQEQENEKATEKENEKELVAKPFLGGLVIFLSVIISTPFDITTRTAFIVLVFLGLFEDFNGVKKWNSFFIQLIALSLIIYKYQGLTPYFPFYLFLAFVLVNSVKLFNMIDGICLAILLPTIFGLTFVLSSKYDKFLLLSSVGALLGLLIYNFPPARMYLGSSGEYFLSSILTVGLLSSLRLWNSNKGFVISAFIFLFPLLVEGCLSLLYNFSNFTSKSSSSIGKPKTFSNMKKCLCFNAINFFKDERKIFYFFLAFGILSFTSGYLAKNDSHIGSIVLIILILIYTYMYVFFRKK